MNAIDFGVSALGRFIGPASRRARSLPRRDGAIAAWAPW